MHPPLFIALGGQGHDHDPSGAPSLEVSEMLNAFGTRNHVQDPVAGLVAASKEYKAGQVRFGQALATCC